MKLLEKEDDEKLIYDSKINTKSGGLKYKLRRLSGKKYCVKDGKQFANLYQCELCTAFANAKAVEKENLTTKYNEHQVEKDLSRQEKIKIKVKLIKIIS
ncbi:hypothetical protein ABEB36_013556 [Hypothenemus hampei]|uniref:Uncharacterized protein n=1 Tax=Hypothenemus hampei TaxID=57062 RepID=A0ABD1E4J2_HYPHA